jgi:hypothetical protein
MWRSEKGAVLVLKGVFQWDFQSSSTSPTYLPQNTTKAHKIGTYVGFVPNELFPPQLVDFDLDFLSQFFFFNL